MFSPHRSGNPGVIWYDGSVCSETVVTRQFARCPRATVKSSADQAFSIWNNSMKQRLTPNYDHEKLDDPTCSNLIDVFEDAWKGYILQQVESLLKNPNGDIAAMTLLCSYFESIEALHRGESSERQSREFFIRGFLRVFENVSSAPEARTAAEAIYRHVRCGVAHTGFPTLLVHIQRRYRAAFVVTYRLLPNGRLDIDSPVASVLVNAERMYHAVNWDLGRYLETLRRSNEVTLRTHFQRLMRSDWGIGQNDNVIGMTEEQFM